MIVHYAELRYSGSLVSNVSEQKVESRDINEIDIPEGVYAVQFFDREEIEYNGKNLTGEKENNSPVYYIGRKYTLEEIKELNEKESGYTMLVLNMEANHFDSVVNVKTGEWFSLSENDIVVNEEDLCHEIPGQDLYVEEPEGGERE